MPLKTLFSVASILLLALHDHSSHAIRLHTTGGPSPQHPAELLAASPRQPDLKKFIREIAVQLKHREADFGPDGGDNDAVTNGKMSQEDRDDDIQVLCNKKVPISSNEGSITCNKGSRK